MYGRGNYGPQSGQGLQRPMPPYQQQPAGGLPPPLHFQQGQPFPMQPVTQQGVLPRGVPPRGPGYPHMPPAPLNMPPQGPSNASRPFLQRPLLHGQFNYLVGQQNFQSQNPHHAAPPPPPPSIGPPRLPPPLPLQPAGYGPPGPHSTPSTQQGIPHMSLPPPPPPPPQAPTGFSNPPNFELATQQLSARSHLPLPPQPPPPPPPSSLPLIPDPPSSSPAGGELSSTPIHVSGGSPIKYGDVPGQNQTFEPESTGDVKTESGGGDTLFSHTDLPLKQNVTLELPPPPAKPADEKVLRKIEVLCQFIAKNGSQFEEMARKNESGNPEFSFLVGGDPGSEASRAHEYFLWMKKKCGLLNDLDNGQEDKNLLQMHADGEASAVLNSSPNVAMVHSPADSDVDMEDDITQTDKEPEVDNLVEDLKTEPVSTTEVLKMQGGETMLLDAREVYNSGEDLKSEPVPTTEVSKMQNQEAMLLDARDSSTSPLLSPPVKSVEENEIKPEDSSDDNSEDEAPHEPARTDSPFRLIRNYASDDNSEDDPPHEQCEAQAVTSPPKSRISTLCDDKSGTISDIGLPRSVAFCVDSLLTKQEAVQSESEGTLTKDPSPGKHELDGKYGGIYATGSSGVDSTASKDIERKDKKSTSTSQKVDEFGRLAKQGASDSESDDIQHVRRRGRRDRSRSRSRSPTDRRRRRSPRRSPRRRKGRRSPSRSWSPKRRRSRSRSPYRSGGDFGAEKLRRSKMQAQECFNFLKGKCYRGSSCRFLHPDERINESSRHYKGKQYQSDVASARNSEVGERVASGVPFKPDNMKGENMDLHLDKYDGDELTSKMTDEKCKTEPIVDDVPSVLNEVVENSAKDVKRGDDAPVEGASEECMPRRAIVGEHSTSGVPSTSQTIHRTSSESHQKDDGPSDSISILPDQISHSPLPPSDSQAINAPKQLKGQVEYNSINSGSFPLQTAPLHVVPPYQHPLPSQQSHYPDPSNSTWSILPPPQPRPSHLIGSSVSGAPLQFQQGSITFKTDFPSQIGSRAQSGELVGHSHPGGFQYQKYPLPSSNVPGKPFTAPNMVRDDMVSQFPSHSHGSAGSFTPGMPPQSGLLPGDSNGMQPFSGSSLLAGDCSKQALHNQLLQQRPPTFGPPLTAANSVPSHLGGSQSVSGYASDPLVREQPPHFPDVGRSIVSAHYNPYASTFDQPMSSRFSSNAFPRERETGAIKYDRSFSLNHGPIEGQTASSYGSRQIMSSPNSSRAGGRMPRSAGDQYDPLFDSIEPSSKFALKQDHAADNSDMLKLSSHQKVLDVAETNKQKEVGAVVPTMSLENDEYGETADAEVGAVENGSFSDSDEDNIVAEGEIEIDQVKPGGDNKKSKDSRSMKLFKVAVANFVKEVLKPQWRQGNMSKEVFKTIVKKTVDKVSGAMKNHRVPKSQAKIDHYIDSSRRKLTQLVEGYVSKYKS